MERDRTESNDLARDQPLKVKELAEAWNAWAARCGVVEWDEIKPTSGALAEVAELPGRH